MRAFVIKEYEHPSKISLSKDAPEPKLTEDEVLVEVFSAGLNYFDVRLSIHPALSHILPTYMPPIVDSAITGQIPGPAAASVHTGLRVCWADCVELAYPGGMYTKARRQGLRRGAGRICRQARGEVEGAAPAA